MSGPPQPRADVRVRRHLAWFVPEVGGVALDASGRLPVQEVGWCFPADVGDLLWPDAAPGAVAALACLARVDVAGEPPYDERVVLVEPVPGGDRPAFVGVWRGAAEDAPPGLPEPLALALAAWLIEATGRVHPDPCWSALAWPGVFATLDGVLARAGFGALGHGRRDAFAQRRAWSLASVWATATAFLKVPAAQWASEGPITAALARAAPDRVPEVAGHGVAWHGSRPLPWMVQQRLDGASREGPEASLAVAAAMGELVRRGAPHVDAWRALGLYDRSAAAVAAELPVLWACAELERLEPEERERLPTLDLRLRARLADLDARRAPTVLAHGDLHAGNALFDPDGRAWIIDWTDAAGSWPGADLLTIVGLDADLEGAELRAVATAYRDAAGSALEPWSAEDLAAGAAAGLVFQALAYARIAASTPAVQRWQLEGTVRFLVRRALQFEGLTP